jgi:hypothetical protein
VDDPRTPTGRPGTRLPHASITWNGAPASLQDIVRGHFVVLAGPYGQPWIDAAERVGAALGVPLDGYRVGPGGAIAAEGRDGTTGGGDEDALLRACGLAAAGAVLVRPDSVLAWSASGPSDDPALALDAVLRRVLRRDPAR